MLAQILFLSIEAANCPAPILPGRWNLRALSATNKFEGSGVVEGVLLTFDGEVRSTAVSAPSFFFNVDCNGVITDGQGQDSISGTLVQVTDIPEARVTTTTHYTGGETYTFTGTVVTGAGGKPELALNVRVVSGSTSAQGQSVAVTPLGTFARPFGGTEDLSGQTLSIRLPVLAYDPDQGVIEVDMRDSPLFRAAQAQVDALLDSSPLPLKITYSGMASFESVSIAIQSVEPAYTRFYLKDIPVMNPFTVAMKWRNSGPVHKVIFRYGDQEVTDESGASSITKDFDMGRPFDRMIVSASAAGGADGPVTVELRKVTVSPWAQSAGLSGASGIVYDGNVRWPPLPRIHEFFGNAPIVGGLWSLLSSGRNDCFIRAHSEGPPPASGELDWHYRLSVPFTSAQMDLRLKGQTSTTLNDRGLKMNGTASLDPIVWAGSKTYGLGELVPGVAGVACGLSPRLCSFIGGMGIEASLRFSVGGHGTFSADEGDAKIEWDTGTGDLKLRGQLTLSVAPPPLDDVVSARVWGAATGCIALKFHPEIAVDDFGAELEVGYDVRLVGVSVFSDTHQWPVVGSGCGSGAPSPVRAGLLAPRESAGLIPTDGQARVALGPGGLVATVWSGLSGAHARPSGDVLLQVADSEGLRGSLRLTEDAAADQSPRAAFDREGRLLVVWQRNPSFDPAAARDQLDAFANGFEIAFAVVDPRSLQLLSSGQLTSNTEFDFGPALHPNSSGEVLLVWGRSRGLFAGGEEQAPVSLHARIWDGNGWSPAEAVAENLAGVYGWSAAFASDGRATLAYTVDGDGQFSHASDQEIFVVQRSAGIWGGARQLTRNNVADRAPVLTYLRDGQLALGWLSEGQVVGLLGDLDAPPRVWIRANDFLGLNFARAVLFSGDSGLFAMWPAAHDLYAVEVQAGAFESGSAADSFSSEPRPVRHSPDEVETAFAAALDAQGRLRVAAVFAGLSATAKGLPILSEGSRMLSETIRLGDLFSAGLRIRSIRVVDGGRGRISWQSRPGARYLLQQSTDLRVWSDVLSIGASAEETAADVDISAGAGARFFRLQQR